MNTDRIPSFTERALLHPIALDWLCPPNCEKRKIKTQSNSVLETLLKSQINPYSGQLKTSYWHWGTKPIKAAGRVIYTALVTSTIVPVGILWFGGYKIPKHLILYTIRVYQHNEAGKQNEWNKTKEYAKAFFTDLTSFIAGGSLSLVMGATIYSIPFILPLLKVTSLAYTISFVVMVPSLIGGISYMLGGFTPTSIIPRLIAYENEKTGMYFALALRDKLGLVNEKGELLPFSPADKVEYQIKQNPLRFRSCEYQFQGKVVKNMVDFIVGAELELIELVQEANELLIAHEFPKEKVIPYSYPFDGKEVIKSSNRSCMVQSNRLLVRLLLLLFLKIV